ncbi:MAG: hypothetical protein KF764_28170 [Labilithrix sp.]|nr:hypothetical protein [Labilithrix sp.]
MARRDLVGCSAALLLTLSGCAPAKPAEAILARWRALPWSVANPEITKQLESRRVADSMNGHFTLSRYEDGELCVVAEQPTVSKALAESNKDLFRIAVARDVDGLKEADPPRLAAASVTVRSTFASVLGEGTVSDVCFRAAGGHIIEPTTQFLHIEVGPTTDGKKSRIFWQLTDPNAPASQEPAPPGQVNRTRKFK